MIEFEFSDKVLSFIEKELNEAEKFIKIAVFQIHNEKIFNILKDKLANGVELEIITLPYDSIYDDVREKVVDRFKNLIEKGGKIIFNKWNVGDVERTSASTQRWYSYHGKFIVTEKKAIALSANLTDQIELDAYIAFNDQTKIDEFCLVFNNLKDLFCVENSGYDGTIRQQIIDQPKFKEEILHLPKSIENKDYINNWIRHYPISIISKNPGINEKLYICPFDEKARTIYESVINDATEYVYISTESFTDLEIAALLSKIKDKSIDIKLLTISTAIDYADRMQKMLRDLLAKDVEIKTTDIDLHAKLVITDKHLLVSSVNLNKMNLGFKVNTHYWRSNTETICISKNSDVIKKAKTNYLEIFENQSDVSSNLTDKLKKEVTNIFKNNYSVRSSNDVKDIIAKLILSEELKLRKKINLICKYTVSVLRKISHRSTVNISDFYMGLIVFYLTEQKLNIESLQEKFDSLEINYDLKELLGILTKKDFIEKDDEFYKIKPNA